MKEPLIRNSKLASLDVCGNSGGVYGSQVLDGYDSRPLREDEFHVRARQSGYALLTEITYVAAPVIRGVDEEPSIEQCPMVLPSSMATCFSRLVHFSANLLPESIPEQILNSFTLNPSNPTRNHANFEAYTSCQLSGEGTHSG